MIILYTGRRGAGKTLTMVKDIIQFYNNGWKIVTNVEIEGIEYELMKSEDIVALDKNTGLNNAVLVIDEIQVLFDSRRSSSNSNKSFSNFIQQIRKRNMILLCTTQFAGTTDLRIRQHTDVIVRPKFNKEYLIIDAVYYDVTATEDAMMGEEQMIYRRVVFDARYVFNRYDTRKTIV